MTGGGIRRFLNLGVCDGLKHVYSLRRLNLSKIDFFHPKAEEAAVHGKVLPTLTPDKARATSRRRTCSTDLATAEATAPKMVHPKPELLMRPPRPPHCLDSFGFVNFFPTASETKVIMADRGTRMLHLDVADRSRCYIDTLPCLNGVKDEPVVTPVPPTDAHLRDGQHTGDLYVIDGILHPDKAEVRPQFEALVWRGLPRRPVPDRSWHCDVLPLPPWISHHPHALVRSHALVGDAICFSVWGAWGVGTYCFHIATREWTKAGDWVMPFRGKADYVPELGLWFGISDSDHLPCAADLSGVVRGEEPPEDKVRIWAHDCVLPEDWQPNEMRSPSVVSLGSGRFIVVDFLDAMEFDKEENEMSAVKQFALFTGMDVAYSNRKPSKDNDNYNASGNDNGVKGKNIMRGLRMIKHKSRRYMFNNQQRIQEVF